MTQTIKCTAASLLQHAIPPVCGWFGSSVRWATRTNRSGPMHMHCNSLFSQLQFAQIDSDTLSAKGCAQRKGGKWITNKSQLRSVHFNIQISLISANVPCRMYTCTPYCAAHALAFGWNEVGHAFGCNPNLRWRIFTYRPLAHAVLSVWHGAVDTAPELLDLSIAEPLETAQRNRALERKKPNETFDGKQKENRNR